jgi:phosphoenolpyruvate carboxylase
LLLNEFESKAVLSHYGIPTVETRIAHSEEEAVDQASQIGFPVVLKIFSDTITHKTDVGGVKLNVQDEIENGLAYYRYTFLAQVPKIYLALASQLRARFKVGKEVAIPPFLRLGSWIGGDRDGNPNVNSKTLSYAIDRQATVAFAHYLDEIHRLGAELSLSTRLVTPSKELLQLAEAAHDPNPHRRDEPYRQALIGVYGRVAEAVNPMREDYPVSPVDPYGASKVAAECGALAAWRSYGVKTIIARLPIALFPNVATARSIAAEIFVPPSGIVFVSRSLTASTAAL